MGEPCKIFGILGNNDYLCKQLIDSKMKKLVTLFVLLLFVTMTKAQEKLYADEFPLYYVNLLDGPLKKARDLNIKTLLQ